MRKPVLAYAKTKTQISFAVTAKLYSAFIFASRIVQSLYFLNTKFQASNHLLWMYSPVCVGPGQKPRRPVFSQRGSNMKSKKLPRIDIVLLCILDLFRKKCWNIAKDAFFAVFHVLLTLRHIPPDPAHPFVRTCMRSTW